jgi:hypothetical protein
LGEGQTFLCCEATDTLKLFSAGVIYYFGLFSGLK